MSTRNQEEDEGKQMKHRVFKNLLYYNPVLVIHDIIYVKSIERIRNQLLSHVQVFVIRGAIAHQAPLSMEFSRQEYWNVRHSLLQKIFLNQDQTTFFCMNVTKFILSIYLEKKSLVHRFFFFFWMIINKVATSICLETFRWTRFYNFFTFNSKVSI